MFAFMHHLYLVCILFGMPSLHLFNVFFSCINSVKEKLYYVWLALLLSSLVTLHIIVCMCW